MTRYLDLIRHTDNDDDRLSDEGVQAALELGRSLDRDYAVAVSTGAQRVTQTIACILAGGGRRVPGGVVVETGLRSDHEDRWRDTYEEAGSGELAAFRSVAPDFVEEEASSLGAALERILDGLDDGERAMVVGHSPTNEAAVLGLTGEEIAPQSKGAVVELTRREDGSFEVRPR